MISIDKLVEIGFTLPQSTDISAYLSNIGYIGTYTSTDMLATASIPTDKVVVFSDLEGLKAYFLPDKQIYKDIECILTQKGNTNPNRSGLNNVIVYQKQVGQANYGAAVDAFVTVNSNYAQILIDSRTDTDILSAAAKTLSNQKLFVAQTLDADI